MLSRNTLKPVCTVLAVLLCLFQIWGTSGFFGTLDAQILRSFHTAFIFALIFLLKPPFKKKDNGLFVALDVLLAVLAMGTAGYIAYHLDYFLNRMLYVDPVESGDIFFGTVLVLLVLEGTRRMAGMPLVIVSLVAVAYSLLGPYLPGALHHSGISYERLIEQMYVTMDGIYGVTLAVSASMIFAFVMFGAFLETSGMNKLFMDMACLLTRKSKGGPAKVAIFASALFGSISGSAPANVYGTGTFTIPLMKRVGYSPAFAGAVEAVASTGGQIMPPVMGAAAFIMGDVTGLGYLAVAKAALIPAVLYYLALLAMIHLEAVRKDIGVIPADQVPPLSRVTSRLHYLLPIILLVYLIVSGRSVNSSAYACTALMFFMALFARSDRMNFKKLIHTFELSARNALMISATGACAGIVVGILSLTGAGFKILVLLTDLASGNLVVMLIVLMITCIIMGMGLPTAPAYIIVATLGAPALTKMGVPLIAAHMFVFYFGILAVVTPPVCVASFAGAAIADSMPMRTGFLGLKLGIVAFIVPFIFVFEPALLMQGDAMQVVQAAATAVVGIIALAAAMQGFLIVEANPFERGMFLITALCMIYPGTVTDLIGGGVLAVVVAIQLLRRGRRTGRA